jgi:hypothetical protein
MTDDQGELARLQIEFQVNEEDLVFNGVDGATGRHLFPKTSLDRIVGVIRGEEPNPDEVADLTARQQAHTVDHLAVIFGRDPERLDEVGWALVAADDVDAEVMEALTPLRDRRRSQAGDLYRELWGPENGVRASDDSQAFLIRHGVDANDVADPEQLPYYVLLVGGPDRIGFSFQSQLGVQRAVGRLHFDTPAEYGRYAANVVAAETSPPPVSSASRVHVFATRNPGDLPTALSASRLAAPLVQEMKGKSRVTFDIGEGATKHRLQDLVQGNGRLDLLFTATHGLGLVGPDQRDVQGALVCQDWLGELHAGAQLTGAEYLAGGDLDAGRAISPTVVFSFGCYTAGTPHVTDFPDDPNPAASADPPFVARLAQRLLAHPRGGCLAFVGHVDRAWNLSFLFKGIKPRILPFSSSIGALLTGIPLGMAMEYVTLRYATTATELVNLLQKIRAWNFAVDDRELAYLWLATNDARNFLIVGDPAIRLPASSPGQ